MLSKFSSIVGRKAHLPAVFVFRKCSDNITYSGGQANSGQGGYYGSGGSRAIKVPVSQHQSQACACSTDVKELTGLIERVDELQSELSVKRTTDIARATQVKDTLNEIMRDARVGSLLSRLVFMGQPVWGLTMKERDFVRWAVTNYLMGTH